MNSRVNINTFIEHHNQSNKLWKPNTPEIKLETLTYEQFRALRQDIECKLSPENLSCDGEMPAEYVQQRGAWLQKCFDELVAFSKRYH